MQGGDLSQEWGDGQGRAAVGAFHDGRDALVDVVFGVGIEENAAPGVGVDVDKAGGDDHAVGVETAGGGGFREIAEGGDGVAFDADVAVKPGVARAVDNAAAGDHDVKLLGG